MYNPQELMHRAKPEKVELIYRSRDMRTVVEDKFELTPPEDEVEEVATKMSGAFWQKMKKTKKAREEAQHALQLGVQLNMFERTVDAAKQTRSRKRPPKVSGDYGERMEGYQGQKRSGKGSDQDRRERDGGGFGLAPANKGAVDSERPKE